MTVQLEVWSDFVCPFCYLASLSVKELQKNHDIEVHWRSYELRPPGSPPMPADYRQYIEEHGHPQMVNMARQQYGVEIKQGPFDISSRHTHIVAKYAEAQGRGTEYDELMLAAYWREGKDVSDPAVIKDVLVRIGLSADGYETALADPQYEQAVEADEEQAAVYGLRGVPALVFAGKYLVSGAQPYATLEKVLAQVQQRESAQTK